MLRQNIIIKEPCSKIRLLGRNALKDMWKPAIITMIVYIFVLELPATVFDAIFGMNPLGALTNSGYTYGLPPDVYAEIYNAMPDSSFLATIYTLAVTGPLTLGVLIYFLAIFNKYQPKVTDLFLGFEYTLKAIGLSLFTGLFVVLWSLLFIVPGIIASIRYSQAVYILADDPTKGIRQCVNESKEMMRGNKGKYFVLSLSFIGWLLLATIPASIVISIIGMFSGNAFVIEIVGVLALPFTSPVSAYINITYAGFYKILAGQLIEYTEAKPVIPVSHSAELIAEESSELELEEAEEKKEAKVDEDTNVEETIAEGEEDK